MKDWAQQKKTNTSEKITEWRSQRQVKTLTDRADGAETYADAAIEVAIAAVDEAERAAVEAIVARMDADAVQAPTAARTA